MKNEYDFSKGKRGAILSSKGKTRITIYLDDSIIEEFRSRAEEAGTGYQTLINEALREYLSQTTDKPVTESMLRRILHEEIPQIGQVRSPSP
ncbi:MAG: BrnA antitoxin family protein [Anaerolineales bacterium]|nr:BrnA antitoxin family protein [Anaerolineales bacterium]MCB8952262.1 BrnA antitoxin family protein [Ardenticatenales bacterium]